MNKYLLTEVGDYAGVVTYYKLLKFLCVLVLCVIFIHILSINQCFNDILEMPTFKNEMSNNVYNLNQANSENVYDYVNSEYCKLESLKVKSKNKFSLLHVNIRSLTKNLEKLEELLADITTLPDIIAITETRLKNSMNFGFRLQGYSIEYHDSPTNAGGVALFVKDSLAYRVKNKFMIDTPGCENLWLQFDTKNSNTFLLVLCIDTQILFTKISKIS